MAARVCGNGRSLCGARERERDGEVGAGLGETHAAHGRDVDVARRPAGCRAGVRAPPAASRRASRRPRSRRVAGCGAVLLTTSAWISTGSARRPSMATVTQVPLTGVPLRRDEQAARVGHLGDAVAGHLEAADLVGGAEAVLERAHEAQRGLPVALELADDVDQVLEHARAGDRAVLGDVADEQDAAGRAPWRRG